MAFILQTSPTYWWPITFEIPIDGNRYRRETFEVEFNRLPQSEVEAIMATELEAQRAIQSGADNTRELLALARTHAERVIAGWRGILDTDGGEPVPFSVTALRQLLEVPNMATVILQVYGESVNKAKVGNSKASPSTGS